MTQKELLYYEDAIKHEENTIKIIESMTDNLKDSDLISFMKQEISKHKKMKNSLIKKLEVESHE